VATYQYQCRNSQGELVTGNLQAASSHLAANQLSRQGLLPLVIQQIDAQAGERKTLRERLSRRPVTIEDLVIFSRQMASLCRAGVPIIRALQGLSDSLRNPVLQECLSDVVDGLESGMDLASSLNRHPEIFNDLYVSVVHVGENTGHLDQAFKQVAGYLELERETRKRIGAATRYPLFVIAAIAVAVGVINVLVIPAFASLFASFDAELPWQTRLLIASSAFTITYWYLILAVIGGCYWGWRQYVGTDEGRIWWDKTKLKIPLIGVIYERIALGRFARTYAMVTRSGVPVIQGLTVVANAVGNRFVASKIRDIRINIERGENLSRAAYQTGMFTPLILQMMVVGEETGSVDDLLDEAADFYEQEVDYDLKLLSDRIEPLLLLVVAAMVLVLALGVFLPMWDLSSAIN